MKKLKQIISEYAGVDESEIKEDTKLVNDIGLDSFAMIALVTEIEQTFNVSISDYELSTFQTLKDVVDYLKENSPNFSE